MKDIYSVIIRPKLTEKAENLKACRKYTFVVRLDATKGDIKRAVEEIYGVKAERVNTMIVRGKPRRRGWFRGKRANFKKAVVTLKPGYGIEFERAEKEG